MATVEIGERVGAIIGADAETIKLLGYGVRIEDQIPPANTAGMGYILHEIEKTNPTLQLDNGDIVFGCECWWGSEDHIQHWIDGREIIEVSIHDYRKIPDDNPPPAA